MTMNRQVHLVARPDGEPSVDNFRVVESTLPPLGDGQVLVRHHYLSIDPYMRGRMSDAKSYSAPQPLGEVMIGGTVGEVVESRSARFAPGDRVASMGGWQLYQAVDASKAATVRKIDTTHVPLAAYLGAVGMPGVTAWYGLTKICQPKAGQTVALSAASGAVGSVVGQLAKARGCRVVGIAGGTAKCAYVVDELGFDACVDYKAHRDADALQAALAQAAPGGIDGHFENVGGMVLDAVLANMNAFGRIALCGMISGYSGEPMPLANSRALLTSRLMLQAFIVSEHMEVWSEALAELAGLVASGELKYRESIAEGLDAAPDALIGMLKGRNFGKQLVKLV